MEQGENTCKTISETQSPLVCPLGSLLSRSRDKTITSSLLGRCQHNSLEGGEVRASPIFLSFWLLQSKSQLLRRMTTTLLWPSTCWLLDSEGIFPTPGPYCLHNPAPADKHYKSSESSTAYFALNLSASSFICRAFDGVWPGWASRTQMGAFLLELLLKPSTLVWLLVHEGMM